MGRLFEIASELATQCAEYADNVAVKLAPDYQLGEHEFASQIYVVPTDADKAIESRAGAKRLYTYEVGLLKWCRDENALKSEVENLDELAEYLLGKQFTDAFVGRVETKALYSVEAYSKRKQYVGVLEVQIEDLE